MTTGASNLIENEGAKQWIRVGAAKEGAPLEHEMTQQGKTSRTSRRNQAH